MPVRAIAAWNGINMTRFRLPCFFALLLFIPLTTGVGVHTPAPLWAHGALMEHEYTAGIIVRAKYDTGQPMAGAQITVYAPDNPTRPWLTGLCDEDGRFGFVPDPALAGTWSIQARLAGHGTMIHIPMGNIEPAARSVSGGRSGYTSAQLGLMAACVVWGFTGTALYFKRGRKS